MKVNLGNLVKAHYGTYADARTGSIRWRDHALFGGLPGAVLIVGLLLGVNLKTEASAALLTVAGLLGGYLFSVMLSVSERAMDWADGAPSPGRETSAHAIFLREIAANAGYASLTALVSSMLFVLATVTTGTANEIASAIGLATALHMFLVVLMVMVRIFAMTENRLNRARTGANVRPIDQQRDAS